MSYSQLVAHTKLQPKPAEDEVAETTDRTKKEIEKIIEKRMALQRTAQGAAALIQTAAPQMVKYTPELKGPQSEFATANRLVRIVEKAKDPFEPPSLKAKRMAPGPPSPPPPVMHSPPRKLTAEDQAEWKIPPCISNWKNPKGWTLPLDKRLLADGRSLNEINPRFAMFSESLHLAERKAKEEIDERAKMHEMIDRKEKEAKEEEYRRLAAAARAERAALDASRPYEADDALKRDAVRDERKRERERDYRLERAKKSKSGRDEERDITEKVALGIGAPKQTGSEALFDTRLFNQTSGVTHGFGSEDDYNIYERPLFAAQQAAQTIYRPKVTDDNEVYGNETDLEKLKDTSRFVPDKGFAGASEVPQRSGPVPFERPESGTIESDPFGLDRLISEAKGGRAGLEERPAKKK